MGSGKYNHTRLTLIKCIYYFNFALSLSDLWQNSLSFNKAEKLHNSHPLRFKLTHEQMSIKSGVEEAHLKDSPSRELSVSKTF